MEKRNRLEVIIGLLAIISIILIAVESLVTLSEGWLFGLYAADMAICLIFAWEFVHRLRYAENRLAFLKAHGFEVLAMVPAFALYTAGAIPGLSAGLRSLRLVRVIRVALVIARQARFFRASGDFVRRSGLIWLSVASLSIIFLGGFVVLHLESGTTHAQITNFSDAMWWSISTVTTVGYGDIVPNTILGRIIGMVLMVVGIGVMAAFISQVSATLVESRFKPNHDAESLGDTLASEIKHSIDRIDTLTDTEVSLLMKMIQDLRDARIE